MMKGIEEQRTIQGFKTIILGCCLLVLEFLFLPIYSYIELLRTGGDGTFRNCLEYAGIQPMPIVFFITGIIITLGIVLLVSGLIQEKSKRN